MSVDLRFSLLLAVYGGDRVDYVTRAFQSAVVNQSRRPDQVVIVRDGAVSPALQECLDQLRQSSPVPVTFLPLKNNGGLGPALDRGLTACEHDIVARMDADDIAMPHRFAVQIPLMAHADIVGAGLLEFAEDTEEIVGQRIPPVGQANILRYARMHDPFNHPTVVYRRTAVIAAGGYGALPLMEDYWLFARMLDCGARAVNVPTPLVYYRVGPAAFKRRGGGRLLRSELQLQRTLHEDGFTTRIQFARNVVVRGGYRLIPWQLRRTLYQRLVPAYGLRVGSAQAQPLQPVPNVVDVAPAARRPVDLTKASA